MPLYQIEYLQDCGYAGIMECYGIRYAFSLSDAKERWIELMRYDPVTGQQYAVHLAYDHSEVKIFRVGG